MHSLQLLAVIGLATTSNCATAFVSLCTPKTIGVHASRYPSTRVSLQHINCYKRKGYHRRSGRRSIGCRSSSSTSLSAIPSPQAVTTSISGFYKAYPLIAGIIVGLVSRLTQYTSRTSRKDTKLSSLNNHNNRNKTNFAIRTLCSGLVLGILFETIIHGSIIFSMCE